MGKLEVFLLTVSLNLLLCSAEPLWYKYEDSAVESSEEERNTVTTQAG